MPTDPVYNPHLPSTSVWNPRSSIAPSHSTWSSDTGSSSESAAAWSAMSAGFVAGAVAGAAIALMLAPSRGAELRSSIRRYAADGSERLTRLVESGRSAATDAVHRASSLLEQGRNALRTNSGRTAEASRWSSPESQWSSGATPATTRTSPQPLTASVAEISGIDSRFDEPLGG